MIAAMRKRFDPSALTIRACAEKDMRAVTEIYAHHVLHGTATFELDPPSLEEMTRRRRALLEGGYVYLVAEADSAIVGYAYVTAYRSRPAYRFTVENSVYVRAGHEGRGIGLRLMRAIARRMRNKAVPPDDRGHRRQRQSRLDRIAYPARLSHDRHLSLGWLQVRPLARQRADAKGTGGRRPHAAG